MSEFTKRIIRIHEEVKSSLGSSRLMEIYHILNKNYPITKEEYSKRIMNGVNMDLWYVRSGCPIIKNESVGHMKTRNTLYYYLKIR